MGSPMFSVNSDFWRGTGHSIEGQMGSLMFSVNSDFWRGTGHSRVKAIRNSSFTDGLYAIPARLSGGDWTKSGMSFVNQLLSARSLVCFDGLYLYYKPSTYLMTIF